MSVVGRMLSLLAEVHLCVSSYSLSHNGLSSGLERGFVVITVINPVSINLFLTH